MRRINENFSLYIPLPSNDKKTCRKLKSEKKLQHSSKMEPEGQSLGTIPEEEEEDIAMSDVAEIPKATAKDNSSDSSDSPDSDSDSEDEAKQNLELQTLELQLCNEPSNYDAHVQVRIDIDKLRDFI